MDFFATATAPFAVALIVTLGIAVIEIIGFFSGLSASAAIDSSLPDLHVPDVHADIPADVHAGTPDAVGLGPLSGLLSWLNFGRLPALVVLILFAGSFGISGFVLQGALQNTIGFMLDPAIASVAAGIGAAYFTRFGGRALARIMPREETDAVSTREFIGAIATILRGEARPGFPAEAKVKDSRGKTHYLLVEPEDPELVFGPGADVLIIGQKGSVYRAVTRFKPIAGRRSG